MVIYCYRYEELVADSRQGKKPKSRYELLMSSLMHIQDVRRLGMFLIALLSQQIGMHDWTKVEHLSLFYDDFLKVAENKNFKDGEWWKIHKFNEKHHVLDYEGKNPVNLLDWIELCCDWVAAGTVRSKDGVFRLELRDDYTEESIKEHLYEAFMNTLRLLKENVRLKEYKGVKLE